MRTLKFQEVQKGQSVGQRKKPKMENRQQQMTVNKRTNPAGKKLTGVLCSRISSLLSSKINSNSYTST
jgi:hypothetical protein